MTASAHCVCPPCSTPKTVDRPVSYHIASRALLHLRLLVPWATVLIFRDLITCETPHAVFRAQRSRRLGGQYFRSILLLILVSFGVGVPVSGQESLVLQVQGRWVLDQDGELVVPPVPGGRMMGLQASGLSFDGELLLSVGDQRSNFPAGVFRIDPLTARLTGDPMRLVVTEETEGKIPRRLVEANPDLEGVSVNPVDPSILYIAVESDGPYILEGRLDPTATAVFILRILDAGSRAGENSSDRNVGFEGIASDGDHLYIALERGESGLPRIYRAPVASEGIELRLEELPVPFSKVPDRSGKGTLNINGIDLLPGGSPLLAMIARDQERLLFYDLTASRLSYVDLDFRDPQGREIHWTSPEGVAVDPSGDRIWIINDPDSVRGNYRRRDEMIAQGHYEAMVPLLFELSLQSVLSRQIVLD